MPRVRRVAKRRRDYEKGHVDEILEGMSIGATFGHKRRGRCDYKTMRAAWDELRDELLPAWIVAHPFTRPVAFWLFDASEPRLRTVGEQRIESIEAAQARKLGDYRACFFESLNIRLGAADTGGNEADWETEKQYLCRLNLLTDGERALL